MSNNISAGKMSKSRSRNSGRNKSSHKKPSKREHATLDQEEVEDEFDKLNLEGDFVLFLKIHYILVSINLFIF